MNKHLFARGEKPRSSVETVVDTIKTLLIRKQLKPGDHLPSETELSESLGISRGPIREAMKILAAFGVVEIRQGDGTYISTSINERLMDPLLFSVLVSPPDLDELFELRAMMEKGIVALIIRHASDEELAVIRAVYYEMEMQFENGVSDLDELKRTDIAFHRAMANATGNLLVKKAYEFVMELYEPTMTPGYALEPHGRILAALEARDLPAALAAVEHDDRAWIKLHRNEDPGIPGIHLHPDER